MFNKLIGRVTQVLHEGKLTVPGKITVLNCAASSVVGSIGIRAHNRLLGIADVQHPPIVESVNSPIKDAFVRASKPYVNYGYEDILLVGGEDSTYLAFSVDFSGPEQTIYEATLKLKQTLPGEAGCSLSAAYSGWSEYDLVWENKPSTEDFIGNSSHFIEDEAWYTVFDLSQYLVPFVKAKYVGEIGFVLEGIETVNFYSRESGMGPVLKVARYDKYVYSKDKSRKKGLIQVRQNVVEDHPSVLISKTSEYVPGYIETFRSGDAFGSIAVSVKEQSCCIQVHHKNRPGVIEVKAGSNIGGIICISSEQQQPGSILVKTTTAVSGIIELKDFDFNFGRIAVNIKQQPGSILVKTTTAVSGIIELKDFDFNFGRIAVNIKQQPGSILVKTTTAVLGIIELKDFDFNFGRISVKDSKQYEGTIGVKNTADIAGIIRLTGTVYSNIPASIIVISGNKEGIIELKDVGYKEGIIDVGAFDSAPGFIAVNRTTQEGILNIAEVDNQQGSITIRNVVFEDVESIVNLKYRSVKSARLSIKRRFIQSGSLIIKPRTYVPGLIRNKYRSTKPGRVKVRQFNCSDRGGTLTVKTNTNTDLPVTGKAGTVYVKQRDYIPGKIGVSYLQKPGILSIKDLVTIPCVITTRQGIPCRIAVSKIQQCGIIDVKQDIKPGVIRISKLDQEGKVEVKECASISGIISVFQRDISNVPSDIAIKYITERRGAISTIGASVVPGCISIVSNYVAGTISIGARGDSLKSSVIRVRIKDAAVAKGCLRIGHVRNYAFIM